MQKNVNTSKILKRCEMVRGGVEFMEMVRTWGLGEVFGRLDVLGVRSGVLWVRPVVGYFLGRGLGGWLGGPVCEKIKN